MSFQDHHVSGASVDDAVALLTVTLNATPSDRVDRLRLIDQIAKDGGVERIVAALEAVLLISTGIIEVTSDAIHVDPAETLAGIALTFGGLR